MVCDGFFKLDGHASHHGRRGTSGTILKVVASVILILYQLKAMTASYKALIKDKEIIAAEVMHEYNEGVSRRLLSHYLPLKSV